MHYTANTYMERFNCSRTQKIMITATHQAEFELSDGPVFFVLLTQHLHSNVPIHYRLCPWPVPVTLGLRVGGGREGRGGDEGRRGREGGRKGGRERGREGGREGRGGRKRVE